MFLLNSLDTIEDVEKRFLKNLSVSVAPLIPTLDIKRTMVHTHSDGVLHLGSSSPNPGYSSVDSLLSHHLHQILRLPPSTQLEDVPVGL